MAPHDRARRSFAAASCIGPVAVKDLAPLHTDIANLRGAAAKAGVDRRFMNSASPGLITAFQPNEYYPTHEAYIGALAEAMRQEYRGHRRRRA